MNIYLLVGAFVIGEVSPTTKKEWITVCQSCNIRELTFKEPVLILVKPMETTQDIYLEIGLEVRLN